MKQAAYGTARIEALVRAQAALNRLAREDTETFVYVIAREVERRIAERETE